MCIHVCKYTASVMGITIMFLHVCVVVSEHGKDSARLACENAVLSVPFVGGS